MKWLPLLPLLGLLAAAPARAQSNFIFAAPSGGPETTASPLSAAAPDMRGRGVEYPPTADEVTMFISPDNWIIRDYFERHRKDQIISREERKTGSQRALPVGLSGQPKAGDFVPPHEINRLPRPLERDLPRLPDGMVRAVIGRDVVLLRTATWQVVDVLPGILR